MKHHNECKASQIKIGCANPFDRTPDIWRPFTTSITSDIVLATFSLLKIGDYQIP